MRKMRVLVRCTGNACRRQMAEGWGCRLQGAAMDPFPAGRARRTMNPYAVQVVAEAGADLAGQRCVDWRLEREFYGY